jgi:hypothetical protein
MLIQETVPPDFVTLIFLSLQLVTLEPRFSPEKFGFFFEFCFNSSRCTRCGAKQSGRTKYSENCSFSGILYLIIFFYTSIAYSEALFVPPFPPSLRSGEALFVYGPLHPIPGLLEGLISHRDICQLGLHPRKQKTVYWHQFRRIGKVSDGLDVHHCPAFLHKGSGLGRSLVPKEMPVTGGHV